ncbi:hypothetical protein [Microvirga sp. M2]
MVVREPVDVGGLDGGHQVARLQQNITAVTCGDSPIARRLAH